MGSRFDAKAPRHCCTVHQAREQEYRVLELARSGAAPREIAFVIGLPTRDVLRMLGLAPRVAFTPGAQA